MNLSNKGEIMSKIHPTAVIEDGVELGSMVEIGAYSVIHGPSKIGAGTRIGSHVEVFDHVEIGEQNNILHSVTIGSPPQDFKYKGAQTKTRIGNKNTFRECVTVHRASREDSVTSIGNNCYFMVYSHVAHDDQLEDFCVLTNCTALAGWVKVEYAAVLSAFIGVHQNCRVGRHAMVGALTKITKDIPPFCTVVEDMPAKVMGLNEVGLKRFGFSEERIKALQEAYNEFFRSDRELTETINMFKSRSDLTEDVQYFVDFMSTAKRGVVYLEKKRSKDFTFM